MLIPKLWYLRFLSLQIQSNKEYSPLESAFHLQHTMLTVALIGLMVNILVDTTAPKNPVLGLF